MCITYSEYVFVALVIQHEMRMRHIFICGLVIPYFSTLSDKQHDYWKKLLNTKCVFGFSLQGPSDVFLILRRIQ